MTLESCLNLVCCCKDSLVKVFTRVMLNSCGESTKGFLLCPWTLVEWLSALHRKTIRIVEGWAIFTKKTQMLQKRNVRRRRQMRLPHQSVMKSLGHLGKTPPLTHTHFLGFCSGSAS